MRAFAYLFSSIEARMSIIDIEYGISLSKIEFRMSQRFRKDWDIFENAPRVNADLFHMDKKDVFSKKIRIHLDKALEAIPSQFF